MTKIPPPREHPPATDELEISILGPGFGESVVIHVGGGRWVVIDSCIDAKTGNPAALDYLEALGLLPTSVELIVATHWHDDHIRGLARLVEACPNAQFACSMALNNREFLAIANLYDDATIKIAPGPTELKRVFEQVIKRRGTPHYRPIRWARSDVLLWDQKLVLAGMELPIRLHALSPSDEMLTRATEEIAQAHAAATKSEPVTLPTPGRPNHISVALYLEVGDYSILLGSDLEETGDPLTGWSAVLSSCQSQRKPSSVFKVAHHGSRTGHDARVWARMVEPNPVALLTPFLWGRHRLPDANDRARILSLTKRAYITCDPEKNPAPKRRKSKVENHLNSTAKRRWVAAGSMGHIRWRASLLSSVLPEQVSTFFGAYRLVRTDE